MEQNQKLINLPPSLNLGGVKQSALEDMRPSFQKLRSQNATYGPRDTIIIPIPTGRRGDYLNGADSYISFKFTPTFTAGSGQLSVDASAYSFFRNIRVRHGSNLLVNQRNCNRLWNALYDIQANSADRESNQLTLCHFIDDTPSKGNNMYGIAVSSGSTYGASFSLPVPLVGALSEKATPLGWMNTSQLYIEIDLEDMNKAFTTRIDNENLAGAGGAAITSISSYTISEVYYHAKITQIGSMYDEMLMQSLGGSITIPAVDYAGDEAQVSASSNINQIFSFPFSSSKAFLWWMTNTQTANGTNAGTPGTNVILRSAISQRNCGALREFNLTLNGQNYPPTPIYASTGDDANHQHMAIVMQELLRCFNLNSLVSKGGVLTYPVYARNSATFASDTTTKRFVAGIDLDRADNEDDRLYQGTNTVNSQVALNVVFDTAPTEAQTVYAFMMYDTAFNLQDGLLSVQR